MKKSKKQNIYSAVLLSGGKGTRMMGNIPKQYMLLAGKPMIMHSIERLDVIEDIDEIIIVCEREYISKIQTMIREYKISKNIEYAPAGGTRQESVCSGLQCAKNSHVIIHEAARPFVTVNDFKRLILAKGENATLGWPVPYTIVKGKNKITGILERSELVNVQLPQKFLTQPLLKAHMMAAANGENFTEDASLLYFYEKCHIEIIDGSEINLKITEPSDFALGEIIFKEHFARRK